MTSATSTVLTAGDRSFPWSGELPATWSTKPLKYLVAMNAKTLGETTNPETLLHYIDIGSVSSRGEISDVEDIVFEDAPSRARRIVLPGDVLISTVRTYLRAIAFCEQARENLICSTGFAVVTARKPVDPKFLFYWARSSRFVDEIVSRSLGVSYPAINAAEISNLPFPLISHKEQQQIAAFLDRKTAELDAVLALKERQLKLLAEKRQALISQAVTRGLDPTAPLKPSGIDWLGDVPRHWEVKRLRYVVRNITNGTTATQLADGESDCPVTRIETISTGSVNLDKVGYVECSSSLKDYLLIPNDILFSHINSLSMIGNCAIYEGSTPLYAGMNLLRLRPNGLVMGCWLWNWLRSSGANHAVKAGAKPAINQVSLPLGTIKDVPVLVPPLDEQNRILAYLNRETASLDGIAQAIRAQIEKVREYRQALISAAVTGKIDVRGVATEAAA